MSETVSDFAVFQSLTIVILVFCKYFFTVKTTVKQKCSSLNLKFGILFFGRIFMAHFKKIPQKRVEDKIIYGDGIVDGIVLIALEEVPYAELYSLKTHKSGHNKSIKVYFDKDGVHVDVKVKIHFTQCVSDMAFKIQETVRHNIESMTEYHVAGVNVIVKGVLFGDVTVPEPKDANTAEKESSVNGEQGVTTKKKTADDNAADSSTGEKTVENKNTAIDGNKKENK